MWKSIKIQRALKDLNSNIYKKRRAAIDTLARVQAIPALIIALQDKDWSIKIAAARALGELHSPQAVIPLIESLRGEDEWVATEAAIALGKIGSADAVPALLEVVHSEKLCASFDAELAPRKEQAPNHRSVVALGQLAQDISQLRSAAAHALGQIKDPRAVTGLIEALHDSHMTAINETAASALDSIGTPEAVQAVTEWRQHGKA